MDLDGLSDIESEEGGAEMGAVEQRASHNNKHTFLSWESR